MARSNPDVVFLYVAAGFKEGVSFDKVVLAYRKDMPTRGGLVLMGDGKVVEMTAEDFRKATPAKPEKKKK